MTLNGCVRSCKYQFTALADTSKCFHHATALNVVQQNHEQFLLQIFRYSKLQLVHVIIASHTINKMKKTKPKTLQSQKQIRQSSNIAFDKQLHKSQQAGRQADRQTDWQWQNCPKKFTR